MYKLVVAQVNAHMRNTAGGIEENEIALFEILLSHLGAAVVLVFRGARQRYIINRIHQSARERGAIDSLFRIAAKLVGCAVPVLKKADELFIRHGFHRFFQKDGIFELEEIAALDVGREIAACRHRSWFFNEGTLTNGDRILVGRLVNGNVFEELGVALGPFGWRYRITPRVAQLFG